MHVHPQYIEPTIRNSVRPMRELNWVVIVERVLKLAIPTLYIWLCMFYTLFHVWLNILAEVLRFGDREFYKVGQPHTSGKCTRVSKCVCSPIVEILFDEGACCAVLLAGIVCPCATRADVCCRTGGTQPPSATTGACGTCRCTRSAR